ncbi:MAG: O-acetylserine/cysteine export protein [Candidatus Bathyarchaeota archaeon BA1]|nr:MAG: O-acetylserine/cysteine export protein [Candidatus Bathyarchaeota archaeon BA1]
MLSRPLFQKYTPLKLATLTVVMGTPPLLLVSIPSLNEQNWVSVSWQGWLCLIYSPVLAIAIGYAIWYTGVGHVCSARNSLYSNLTAVIAVAVAWLFLSERMTLLQVLGALLVFISLYLARASMVTGSTK